MKSRSLRPLKLTAAIAALVAVSGISANRTYADSPGYVSDTGKLNATGIVGPRGAQNAPARYIVRFEEQPLALYNATAASRPVNGISAIPTKTLKNGRTRLDVHSTQATAYVQYVKEQQQQHLNDINSVLGQTITPRYSMQHALNAVVVELTAAQAAQVAKVAGVLAVNRDEPHPLATDIGPGFIGASSVWFGTPAGQDTIFADGWEGVAGFRGDGIVIGDIDTGYNSLSPSFSATDINGYTITNPLGTGNFLPQSQCGVADISLGGCNDKVIGVYDEINLTGGGPPYSVEDVQGHGSHTASTAGGNFRSGTLAGYTANLAGVAPHANLVIYYACSPDPAVQCSTSATSASVDQAVQDGVVDALNYSISGGSQPWSDPTSQAFMAASDAGIFIAAAAGNTGTSVPLAIPGTANHAEPWVITVAAANHTGGAIAPDFSITAAGAPANVQNLPLTEAAGDTPPTATVTAPVSFNPATFNVANTSGNDGCSAFGSGQFAGQVALISRGTCSFYIKVENALAAGAVAVLLADNRPEGPQSFLVNDGGTTTGAVQPIPVYSILQSQAQALQTYLAANSNTAASAIPYPPIRQPAQPDQLASFSLLGPVNIDVMKPDVQAPGVQILAAFNNLNADSTTNGPDNVGLDSGTSMATPHTTGSGALMFGVHPEWTPAEAKSALMMTAKEVGLTKPNGVTPSDYFDRGSGRLQDYVATKAGLVLNETGLNYSNADPSSGGDPSSLNIASLDSRSCVSAAGASCAFTRRFHSAVSQTVTWTATVTGDPALNVTVTPSSFAVVGHATRPVDFNVDAAGTNGDGVVHYAEVTLTPSDATLPALHLPVAVVVPPPSIAASPQPLTVNITSGTSGTNKLTVSNTGGATLNVTNTNDTTTASAKYVLIDQPSQGNNGYYSSFFTDAGAGSYASDDFVVPVSGAKLTKIFAPGFSTGTALTGLAGHGVHFRVYADAAGLPNGDPEAGTSVTPAVYSFDTTIGGAGLSVAGNNISLDLNAAGAPASNLAAGTYWLVVYVDMAFGANGGWAQFVTTVTGNGAVGAEFGPVFSETAWASITDAPGFAMHIEQQVACGAPWLSTAQPTLTLAAQANTQVTVNVDGTQFTGTAASAFLCLDSNDPAKPVYPVPVKATKPAVPALSKAFLPNSVLTGGSSTATITLNNPAASTATLTSNLVDTLPANLIAATGSASTTCAGGSGASVTAGGTSVTLGSGAQIPAGGSCALSFNASASSAGTYTNTLAAGALQTDRGNSTLAASADLIVGTSVSEGFDDVTTLTGKGWLTKNNSAPAGSISWFQGNPSNFVANDGASNAYISVNYNSVTGNNTISNWLVTPLLTFNGATSLSFFTRTTDATFADRLEVRLCTSAPCTDVGMLNTDVGGFTTVLKSINPNLLTGADATGANGYPTSFTQFTVSNADGIPASGTGRIAFRYFVTNGGPSGSNSDTIGIDTVVINAGSVNRPADGGNGSGISSANPPASAKRTH